MTRLAIFLFSIMMLSSSRSQASQPLWAFDNALTDVESLEQKASLLQELGYAGIVWRPGRAAEMLDILDQHDLTMVAIYVVLSAIPKGCPIPANTKAEIEALRGRETLVWLTIRGDTSDAIALSAIQDVADLASQNGLRVALYPHYGFKTDTVETCLRLLRQADRPNLGMSFNLCHFLRQNDESQLAAAIEAASPYLWLVSTNGTDSGDTRQMGWDRLIQPLNQGTFDQAKLLRLLRNAGYQGPIVLQGFGIEPPAQEHLAASMRQWRQLTEGRWQSNPTVPSPLTVSLIL